jgi:hypothetical protein
VSGFSAGWLALREPLDAAARSTALIDALLENTGPHTHWNVIDLGAGSGSNLRYLSPRLAGVQRWTLVDHDAALLEVAAQHADPANVTVELRRLDLDREFSASRGALNFPSGALVTASALLDLVSRDWIDALAARCHAAGATVHFALSYDGRTTCDPVDSLDASILESVNRHQRGDKGFGPALGPDAAQYCIDAFTRAGYAMRRATSDWQIDSTHATLQAALINGWADAAIEGAEALEVSDIDAWRARRLALVASGRSRLIVGHEDLVGWRR